MKGKVVFITGGGTGIGKETALLCAAKGARAIIVGGRRLEKLQETVEQIRRAGCEAMAVQVDVSKPEVVENCFRLIEERYGSMDAVVNNAGVCLNTPFDQVTAEEWDMVMRTNLYGTFYCTRKAIALMVKGNVKGSIVNLSSIAAKLGAGAVGVHYAVSKAGISNLTISAATYAARHGIRVNAVAPGPILTDMTEEWNKEMSAKLVKTIPLRTFGQADDVAEAIAFLASSQAKYITGEIIDINGGACMD